MGKKCSRKSVNAASLIQIFWGNKTNTLGISNKYLRNNILCENLNETTNQVKQMAFLNCSIQITNIQLTCFELGPNTLSNVNVFWCFSKGLSLTITSLLFGHSTTLKHLLCFSWEFKGLELKQEIMKQSIKGREREKGNFTSEDMMRKKANNSLI